jgi:RNA polymerase sigma-70 factor, ECF subfamily
MLQPTLQPTGPIYAGPVGDASEQVVRSLTEESRAWMTALRGPAGPRDQALAELHALLLRATRFELGRRRHQLDHVTARDIEDLAVQAADDALMAILGKLDGFRGASRFTTWAYKFALLEAGVKARRRAWQSREIVIDTETWPEFPDAGRSAQQCLEDAELLRTLRDAVQSSLTPHQREVFSALALNGVPIDVLAERLSTTRGALYKTLHDARRKLRLALGAAGYALDVDFAMGGER